jgi:hypothetical protein
MSYPPWREALAGLLVQWPRGVAPGGTQIDGADGGRPDSLTGSYIVVVACNKSKKIVCVFFICCGPLCVHSTFATM